MKRLRWVGVFVVVAAALIVVAIAGFELIITFIQQGD